MTTLHDPVLAHHRARGRSWTPAPAGRRRARGGPAGPCRGSRRGESRAAGRSSSRRATRCPTRPAPTISVGLVSVPLRRSDLNAMHDRDVPDAQGDATRAAHSRSSSAPETSALPSTIAPALTASAPIGRAQRVPRGGPRPASASSGAIAPRGRRAAAVRRAGRPRAWRAAEGIGGEQHDARCHAPAHRVGDAGQGVRA